MPDQPGNMFCRKCDYPLRDVSRDACPECGRAFDSDKRRTFRKRPRRAWVRRLRRAVLLLFVLYVGSYVLLVRPSVNAFNFMARANSGLFHSGAALPMETPGEEPRRFLWINMPRDAEYKYGGEFIHTVFAPANWLDRRIRQDLWTHYGCAQDLVPILRRIDQLMPSIVLSEQGQADLKKADDLNLDLMILAPGTPAHKSKLDEATAHLEMMIDRYK